MLNRSSKARAERVVRYTRADGTRVEKRYPAYDPNKPAAATTHTYADIDTLEWVIERYERSPHWLNLRESSKRSKTHCLRRLAGLGRFPIADIKYRHLIETRDTIAATYGQGAASDFAAAVSKLFSWAKKTGLVEFNVATDMQDGLKRGEFRAWTEADADLAEKHLPERLRRIVILARWTAQRRGDLIKMAWSDIWTKEDGSRWIHVIQEKTGAEIDVPILPELDRHLDTWRADSNVVPLRGKPSGTILNTDSGVPWAATNVSAQLNMHLAKIPGIPKGLNVHGLRKLACAWLANQGHSAHEIMAMSGHTTLAMVQHYTKTADQQKNAAAVLARARRTRNKRS